MTSLGVDIAQRAWCVIAVVTQVPINMASTTAALPTSDGVGLLYHLRLLLARTPAPGLLGIDAITRVFPVGIREMRCDTMCFAALPLESWRVVAGLPTRLRWRFKSRCTRPARDRHWRGKVETATQAVPLILATVMPRVIATVLLKAALHQWIALKSKKPAPYPPGAGLILNRVSSTLGLGWNDRTPALAQGKLTQKT
jgi:hypothetical protein